MERKDKTFESWFKGINLVITFIFDLIPTDLGVAIVDISLLMVKGDTSTKASDCAPQLYNMCSYSYNVLCWTMQHISIINNNLEKNYFN